MRRLLTALASTLVFAGTILTAAPAGAAADFTYPCFGYTGTFKGGTKVIWANWNQSGGPDECFGVGPDRKIYHAWPGSGGFDEMPWTVREGFADNMIGWSVTGEGVRQVVVWVADGSHWYANWYPASHWYGWYNCTGRC